MALQFYHGIPIGGGGTTVLPMTRAEYEANKTVLDASDFLIDITDEQDQLATASEIGFNVGSVNKSMGYIGDMAVNSLAGKVETGDSALYAHSVGEYFVDKDGKYRKCTSAIQVGESITNSNSSVTSIGQVLKNPALLFNTVTKTGTTSSSGNLPLGINSDHVVIATYISSRIAIPICSSNQWYAHITNYDATPLLSVEVTVTVIYL